MCRRLLGNTRLGLHVTMRAESCLVRIYPTGHGDRLPLQRSECANLANGTGSERRSQWSFVPDCRPAPSLACLSVCYCRQTRARSGARESREKVMRISRVGMEWAWVVKRISQSHRGWQLTIVTEPCSCAMRVQMG